MKKLLKFAIVFIIFIGFETTIFAQQHAITIKSERNQDNSVDFYYEKSVPGSYTISVELTNLINAFNNNVVNTFNIVSSKVDAALKLLAPGDVYMAAQLSVSVGKPFEEVDDESEDDLGNIYSYMIVM